MGVIPTEQEYIFKIGDIVTVRRGKYKGKLFVLVGIEGESRVWITDGNKYSVKKPKKKNVLHLQGTLMNLKDVTERIASGKPLDNGWLTQKISAILANSGTSWRQGG